MSATEHEAAALDALFARLADGDRAAIPPVFEALWPIVLRACERLVRVPADAEDAAQTALIRLFAQATRYERGRSVQAWALALAWWECRTVNRKRDRDRHAPVEAIDLLASPTDIEGDLNQARILEAVGAALAQLPREQRAAVEAAITGEIDATAPAATVRKRRQRALDYLRSLFAPSSSARPQGGRHD